MDLQDKRTILTGATGGIGSAIAEALIDRGAKLVLLGRDVDGLDSLRASLAKRGSEVERLRVDLLDGAARTRAVQDAVQIYSGVDLLINAAGVQSFQPFEAQEDDVISRLVEVNLTVPMLLTRQILPHLRTAGQGTIVNIGSTFGSIGFAFFAGYSAAKFGLRGFSEALRRELADSRIGVIYVAPRAVRTKMNTAAVYRMGEATKMAIDDPTWVAAQVVEAIEKDAQEVYLGFPEKLFARINAALPRLIDSALRKQTRAMAPFARDV